MNIRQEATFRDRLVANKASLRNLLKLGADRNVEAKEENFRELLLHMQALALATDDPNMAKAATIASEVFEGRPVEIQRPPADGGAARKLALLQRDSSSVQHTFAAHGNVQVHIDNDQLKHQHPTVRIGNRMKGGGNRFNATATAAWHQTNTMTHMAQWANGLAGMANGEQRYHGQMIPVRGIGGIGDIHYEGYCLMANGMKHVLFHCYPANGSPLLM